MEADWVSITLIYSPDDGGWYGEVFASRLGRPGQQSETGIFPTREAAGAAARQLADKYPDLRRVFCDDIK